jgi:hypothetical protein
VPDDKLVRLAAAVLDENWGRNRWILKHYLAIHVGLVAKQNRFVHHFVPVYLESR